MTMTMNPLAAPSVPAKPASAVGHAAGEPVPDLTFGPMLASTGGAQTASASAATSAPVSDEASADETPVDVLDAMLMQALDEMLNRGPAALVAPGAKASTDEATSSDPATPPTVPATTLAMLMPALIPGVMPPAPVGAGTSSASTASSTATGPASASAGAAPDALASLLGLPLTAAGTALTADAARIAAPQGVGAGASSDDLPAWQGLQRWSAELMTAMGATGAMSAATPAGLSAGAAADGGAMGATLTLPASREAWQQPLMQALGDRLQLQIAQRTDSARLHLEPPQLGRIEIDIRQQGGALQVQLSASHDEVRQQLRQIAEPLRHELVQRHAGDVSVQVATGAQAAGDGRGRDGAAAGGQAHANGQQRDDQRQPGRALQDDDHGAPGTAGTAATAFAFADALAGGAAGVTGGHTRTSR